MRIKSAMAMQHQTTDNNWNQLGIAIIKFIRQIKLDRLVYVYMCV